MGVVYRAVDEDLGRVVALKFIPPEFASSPETEKRFLTEARAASALDHVNIGTIFGVEETEDGRRFIVMAYYEGRNLSERIGDTDNPLGREETIEIVTQVARGLEAAHSRGIIHRDIKPSNILITGQRVVKIVDFGLASIGGGDGLTETGARLGTPAFMSPEQALGKVADHRSDIWALGVVLCEMLLKRRVFGTGTVPSVLFNIVHGELPSLEGIEAPLRRAIDQALKRDPAARFQTMTEFRKAIEGQAPSPTLPVRRYELKHRALIAGIGVLGILGYTGFQARDRIAGGPAKLLSAVREPSAYDQYLKGLPLLERWDKEGNLERAIELFSRSTTLDPKFALGFARLAEAQRLSYALKRDKGMLEKAGQNAAEALRLNSDLAPVQVALGRVQAMRGNNDLAFASFERALRIDPNDAESSQAIARQYEKLGRLKDAEAAYRRAISLNPDSISIHDSYGNYLFRQSRHEEAAQQWQNVIRIAPDHAAALVNLGSALSETGKIAEAISMYQRAVELKPSSMGLSNLGTAYSRANRYMDAVGVYRRAIEMDAKDSMVWGNLAYVYSWMKDNKQALATFDHAIELAEAKRRQNPRDAYVHSDLAQYYAKKGDSRLAIERLNTALALSPETAEINAAAAEVFELLGQRAKGVEFADKSIRLGYSRQRLKRNPELAKLLQDLKLKASP